MENIGRNGRRAERSYLSLLPWRNFRRALFLLLALLAVVALKRSGGGPFKGLIESVAPPAPAPRSVQTTVHLQVRPADR
jgi:hypothetical protein